jgi:BASS family bile acid:Na+ symporter
MEFFGRIRGIELQMGARDVALIVLTSVLLPLVAGMSVRVLWPGFADSWAEPIGKVATVLLALACLPILFTSIRAILTLVGDGTLFALAAFAIVGIIVGHVLGGPNPDDRRVLALATSVRHPAIALAIAHANFPGQKLAGAVILIYVIVSSILAAPYVKWHKRALLTTDSHASPVTH